MKKTVRLAFVQMKMNDDQADNLRRAVLFSEQAAKRGAQIICLPELYRSLYFCRMEHQRHFSLAEGIPGPSTEAFSAVAKKHKVVIIVPIFEKRAQGLFHNSAVVIDADGNILGTYRKMHIPDDPAFYEKFYFTPGDRGFQSFKTKYGTIGVLICWDQWYPEAARLTAMHGAQILFYPTAIGWFTNDTKAVRKEMQSAWETIQRSHAIANGVFVCAVNRVGKEGKTVFFGNSFVSDPFGNVLKRTGMKEGVFVVPCTLQSIDATRSIWPFLRDRRIDAYKGITKRYLD